MNNKKIEKMSLNEIEVSIKYISESIEKQKKTTDYHSRINNVLYNKRFKELDALVYKAALLKKQQNEK